jgi:hypothetical protein
MQEIVACRSGHRSPFVFSEVHAPASGDAGHWPAWTPSQMDVGLFPASIPSLIWRPRADEAEDHQQQQPRAHEPTSHRRQRKGLAGQGRRPPSGGPGANSQGISWFPRIRYAYPCFGIPVPALRRCVPRDLGFGGIDSVSRSDGSALLS